MLSNSYSTKILGIPSPIILNNYSIQNLIITPKEIDPYYNNIPVTPYENTFQNNNPLSYSPSPSKVPLKNYNNYFNPINLYNNPPSLTSKQSYNNINMLRISSPPMTTQNKNQTKIIPITKTILDREKIKERHPQDSVGKKRIKNNNINFLLNEPNNIKHINFEKNGVILKSSVSQKHLNISKKITNKEDKDLLYPKNNLSKRKKKQLNDTKIIYLEPKNLNNLKEFIIQETIGKGTFGKIFSVIWKKNNKSYAMKKEILNDYDDVKKRKNNCLIMQDFVKKTGNKGVINLFGNLCYKNKNKINIIINNINN